MSGVRLCGFLAAFAAASTSVRLASAGEGRPPAGGKHVVCVIDVSGSMMDNDPERYNEQGPQLAVALSGRDDQLGVVTFSSTAQVHVPMQPLSNIDVRRAVQERLQRMGRRGRTNYIAALRSAYEMLEEAGAGPDSAVVFLSDGTHTVGGKKSEVIEAARPFADKGWRIYAIGLGARLDATLLEHLSARTSGAMFRVIRSEDLLTAFLKIFEIIHGYFTSTDVAPTLALPGTKRLVAVSIRGKKGGSLQGLLREGVEAPEGQLYKYPERSSRKIRFEAMLVEDPEPGIWEPKVEGEPQHFAILQKLPYVTRFDKEAPRPLYYEDEDIPVALVVEASSREILDTFRENVTVACTLNRAETDETAARLELQPRMDGQALRYEGKARVELSQPGREERFVVKASSLIDFKSRHEKVQWASEQAVTTTVRPGSRPSMLVVDPKPLELGQHWLDDEPFSGTVSIVSKIQEKLQLHIESAREGMVVSPVDLMVTSTDARDVEVRVETDKFPDPGLMEERLPVTGFVLRTQEELPPDAVAVVFSLHRFTGPEGDVLDLGEVPPRTKKPFPLGISVEPEVELAFELSEMKGPAPISVSIAKAEISAPVVPEGEVGPSPGAELPAIEEGAAPAPELEVAPALEEGIEPAPEDGTIPPIGPDAGEEDPLPAPDGAGAGQEVDCIVVDLPLDQMPGEYTGELTISFPGTTLSPRKYTVRLTVRLPDAGIAVEPEVIELLATETGDVTAAFTLQSEFPDSAVMTCEVSNLRRKGEPEGAMWQVSKDFGDVAVSPAGPAGWNGQNVDPGESYSYDYRAFVYADLPNGVYEGEVTLLMNYKGTPVARKQVPVVLKVVR